MKSIKISSIIIVLTLIQLFMSQTVGAQPMSKKIIRATELGLDDVKTPEIMEGNKSPTLNGTGYIFFTISPVGKSFLEQECKPGKRVFEIGSGYNNIPIIALKNGVEEYVANDLSMDHLKILIKRVQQENQGSLIHNLFIMQGKAPSELPSIQHKYDAILMDKVIHFLNPDEISQLIEWSKAALKKGGRLYVTAASPYSKLYARLLPEYLKRQEERYEFPGHFKNIMGSIDKNIAQQNYQNYKVPDEMVLFSRPDLVSLFQNHELKVISSCSLKLPTESTNEWVQCPDNESNVVGIIAVNG